MLPRGTAQAHGAETAVVTSGAGALERALQAATPDDVILACGSLFVVAEVRAAWAEREAAPVRVAGAGVLKSVHEWNPLSE